MQKTSAWPLSLIYASLIVYASLYPFGEWRDQGIFSLSFLWQHWPKYWTGFDVGINLLGYAPFGFLLALGGLRSGRGAHALLWATLIAAGVSLALETAQVFLTSRVASNVDFALNAAGAWLGASVATLLEKGGALDRWSQLRQRWFVADARGGMVLLGLWPMALLYPAAVPLGLGQVMERLEESLADWLRNTPFLDWLPVRAIELQPMTPSAEMVSVWLGALIPCLIGFCVVRGGRRRGLFALMVMAGAVGVTALSHALSFGPVLAWSWFGLPVKVGLSMALATACVLLLAPRRVNAALAILQTLHAWEQGRFIRFNGVAQWLAWLWPYASLAYVLTLVTRADA